MKLKVDILLPADKASTSCFFSKVLDATKVPIHEITRKKETKPTRMWFWMLRVISWIVPFGCGSGAAL